MSRVVPAHQNLPSKNLPEHLGLETLPWNAEYPSLEESVVLPQVKPLL